MSGPDIIDSTMLEFRPALFRQHVGSRFRIRLDDGATVELTLEELTLYAPTGESPVEREGVRTPFSLFFSAKPLMPQRTYRLGHDALGELDLFLVPIGPGGEGFRYEAVFS